MKNFYSLVIIVFLAQETLGAQEKPVYDATEEVVVIGAGLAGLDIGYRLLKAGIPFSIWEAHARVGGRVLSALQGEGCLVELGGENIYDGGSADHIRALMEELGIELSTTVRGSRKRYHFDGMKHIDFDDALRAWNITPKKLKKKLMRLQKSARNMQEVLLKLFGSSESVLYQSFSMRLAAYEGAPVEDLSPLCTETLCHIITNKMKHVDVSKYALYGFAKEGNSCIAETLADAMRHCIHLSRPLISLEKDGGVYRLSFASGDVIYARHVVLTIPCPVYRAIQFGEKVIPPDRLEAIRGIICGTNAKIIVPVRPPMHEMGVCTGNSYVMAFQGSRENSVTMFYIGDQGRFTQETITDLYQRDRALISNLYEVLEGLPQPCIAQDMPYAQYKGPVGYSWSEDPYVQCSYSCLGMGQERLFTSLGYYANEQVKTLFAPIDDSLFFAGEAASVLLAFGGTMEAAVESGERIARILIRKLRSQYVTDKMKPVVESQEEAVIK